MLGLFAAFFLVGELAHYTLRDITSPVLVHLFNARPSAAIINVLTPAESVVARGPLVINARAAVLIAQGCEGTEAVLLFCAAVLAAPAALGAKALGVFAGTLCLYLANLVRIVGLFYVQRHAHSVFDSMHFLVGQSLLVVLGLSLFALWLERFGSTGARP